MNKGAMIEKYISGLSIKKISEMTSYSYHNIRKVLMENNVIRDRKKAVQFRKTTAHPLEQKIIDRYVSENSLCAIKEGLNVGFYTIKKILAKNRIKCRTRGEANALSKKRNFALSKDFLKVIDGELLGDGCIERGVKQSRFVFVSKHKEYTDWLAQNFTNNGVLLCGSGVTKYNTFHKYLKKYYVNYRFTTLSYANFHDLEKKWYYNRKKIIPRDLEISPQLVLHWYLGDGSLINRKHVIMCTNCFDYEEQLILSKKLNRALGINSSVIKSNGYVIFIRQSEVPILLEYIGSSPLNSMKYKWEALGNKRKKFDLQKDVLYDLYITKNMSQAGVASLFGCSDVTISNRLNLLNIRRNK
jgi:hypothetical protein